MTDESVNNISVIFL